MGLAELLGLSASSSGSIAERVEAFRHHNGAVLIAVEWGPPSGVIALSWHPTLEATALTAQITTLIVAPDARRRGIARALIKAASQSARNAGCGDMQILVQGHAPSLDAFCLATGFIGGGASFVRPLRKKN